MSEPQKNAPSPERDAPRKDPVFDAISGHNRVVILFGGVAGIATAFAASKGLITPQSAIPSFGWVLFALLAFELAYSYIKGVAPAQLISMPGRILALIAGVGMDIVGKSVLGVA